MPKVSAGLLMYRIKGGRAEYFLVHPGGPFFKGKDEGFWSIPKGELNEGEEPFAAAQREFKEETGIDSHGPFIPLEMVTLKSGKRVHAWAFQGDWSGLLTASTYVKFEWPAHSGKYVSFPEIDKAGFFSAEKARRKLNVAQAAFIDQLEKKLLTLTI